MKSNKKSLIIYGSKIKNNTNNYVNEKNFQSPVEDYKSTISSEEIKRIQNLKLHGKSIKELFAYGNVSLWWFMYPQLFDQFHKIISFIINFSNFIERTKPDIIRLEGDFERFDIIKQLCYENNIKFEYSKVNLIFFRIFRKIKLRIRKMGTNFLTSRKIKTRKILFFDKKKPIPELENKKIFAAAEFYRRDLFNLLTGNIEKGEFLLDDIIDLLEDKENILCIDLFGRVRKDNEILRQRLEEKLTWIPVDVLFKKNWNRTKKIKFFKNYNKLISSSEFRKLFEFKGILLSKSLDDIFQKLKNDPYLPYWINLIESLTLCFSKEKPKVIFLPYETGPLALAFISVSKKLDIKTIGLQHGMIYDYHKSYTHQDFESIENPYGSPLPDRLLLYGEIPKEMLLKKNYPQKKLVVFGNPTFFNIEKILSKLNSESIRKKYEISENKKIILFTPVGYVDYYEKGNQFNANTQIWNHLISKFLNNPNVILILKPHPWDIPTKYQELIQNSGSTNAYVIQGNLLELIYLSSVVVSTFSTTMIDALCFGKPVVQVRFDKIDYKMPFDNLDVIMPKNLEDLSEGILEILNNEELRKKMVRNSGKFVKKYYNIPIDNPESILQNVLNES